jgi:hypothetical protein
MAELEERNRPSIRRFRQSVRVRPECRDDKCQPQAPPRTGIAAHRRRLRNLHALMERKPSGSRHPEPGTESSNRRRKGSEKKMNARLKVRREANAARRPETR